MLITIKLQHGDDIRRISFDDTQDNIAMSELFYYIKSLFIDLADVPTERLFINYMDPDGDHIRITNDMEYLEAISWLNISKTKSLKLFIRVTPLNVEPNLFVNGEYDVGEGFSLKNIVDTILSQLYAKPNITSTAPMLAPDSNSNALFGVITNIVQSLPAEQLTPVLLSLMQSSGIQQLVPQLMASFLSGSIPVAGKLGVYSPVASPSADAVIPVPSSSSTEPSLLRDTKDASTEAVAEMSSVYTSTISPSLTSVATSTPTSGMVDATTQHEIDLVHESATIERTWTNENRATNEIALANENTVYLGPFAGSKFGSILQQLTELGFSNAENNISILVKHSGDIEKTIDELVSKQ